MRTSSLLSSALPLLGASAGPWPLPAGEEGSLLAMNALIDVHPALLVGRASLEPLDSGWAYLARGP